MPINNYNIKLKASNNIHTKYTAPQWQCNFKVILTCLL